MVPASSRRTVLLVCCVIVGILVAFVWPASPLSLTTGEPEPASLYIEEFEIINSGCADNVSDYVMGQSGGGGYERVTFIETETRSPNLSVRTERTSEPGADLESFRVYIDSHGEPQENTSCTLGAQYRVELDYDPGEPDAKGTSLLYVENGEYAGCSSSTSGSIETECHRFTYDQQHSNRTWANETAE